MSISLATPTCTLDPAAPAAGTRAILAARLWCVLEVCLDVPEGVWEPRLLICCDEPRAVAAAVEEFVRTAPGQDVRLAGYTRDTLRRVDAAPAPLCHVAGVTHAGP